MASRSTQRGASRSGSPCGGRVDRVGLDLGARHQLARRPSASGGRPAASAPSRRRRRSARARAPGSTRPSTRSEKRDGVDRAGRAAEVDPRAAVVEGARRRRVADAAGGGHRERLEAAGGGLEALQHAARPGRQVAGAGAAPRRARCSSPPSTLLWPCSSVSAVARTTLRARPTASISALSSRGRGLLGELDVVDDRAGAVAAQAVDRLRVARARERPRLAEVVEGLVVDGHHQQARRRHRAAALEALVDRVLLEAGQQARELRRTTGADGDRGRPRPRRRRARRRPCGGVRPPVSPPGARGDAVRRARRPCGRCAGRGRRRCRSSRASASRRSGRRRTRWCRAP